MSNPPLEPNDELQPSTRAPGEPPVDGPGHPDQPPSWAYPTDGVWPATEPWGEPGPAPVRQPGAGPPPPQPSSGFDPREQPSAQQPGYPGYQPDQQLQQAPYQQGPYQQQPRWTQPFPGGQEQSSGRIRPWWGLGDVLLSIPFILFFAIVGTIAAIVVIPADQRDDLLNNNITPPAVLAIGLVFQQLAQGAWPVIVAKWKGFGTVRDWRLRFKLIDIPIGVGAAIGMALLAGLISFTLTSILGSETVEESNNTQFLDDASGSPWLIVLVLGAVVGAPLVEELFFRGLTMRAFEKRFSKPWAVVGSTVVFVLPHFTGAGFVPTLILFGTIGVVGAVLGTLAMWFDRLGPAIVAHLAFNSVGVTAALLGLGVPGLGVGMPW